ncbi:isochorismate synthase MenF [Poseidonocella sp. HB161398]|uniref:isochorismate synthase n=1 Tax=Poseidonocella sp. HB161398 TaxID=2320855 RepID=UPI001107EE56|nr:isochorismate synthase [Poseidonocella sp. HB161398]
MISLQEQFPAQAPDPDACLFAFRGGSRTLVAEGSALRVPPGPASSLEERLAAVMARMPKGGAIGGALPFDSRADDYLFLAASLGHHLPDGAAAAPRQVPMELHAEPSPADYARAVSDALAIMGREGGSEAALRKVVLARSLAVQSAEPFRISEILASLSEDPAVVAYQVAVPGIDGDPGPRYLVGATPELLVKKTRHRVLSHPLAGSARRCADPVEDAAAAASLAGSAKDKREHAMVVEYILDTLAPDCRSLGCPEGTRLTSTRSMWHLGTRIEGVLKDDTVPSAVLAARLHPTPAVCGLPCRRAEEEIRRLEPVPRGFYAGAVGWSDAHGDGAWYVAIRCAEICGARARLYAGAGIVPGSDPQSEVSETGAKFGALLAALGLSEGAALADGAQV